MTIVDLAVAALIGIVIGILGWLFAIAAVILSGIVPVWVAAVIGMVAFVLAMIFDVTVRPPSNEPPEDRGPTGPPEIVMPEEGGDW